MLNNNTAHSKPLSLSRKLLPNSAVTGYATELAWSLTLCSEYILQTGGHSRVLNNNTAHSKPLSLSGNVFPNYAIIGYATERALLIISTLCLLNWHGTSFSEYILQTGRDPRAMNNTAHFLTFQEPSYKLCHKWLRH